MLPVFHVTLATPGRRTGWSSRAVLLHTVRIVTEVGGDALLCFGIVDNHVHLVLIGPLDTVRGRVNGMAIALRHRLDLELESPRIRPVQGQRHLENTMGYCFEQAGRHGISDGPVATLEATALLDLLGARRLRGFDPEALRRQLPRVSDANLWARAGRRELDPVTVPDTSLSMIVAAGASAAGREDLRGKAPELVDARRATLQLARRAGFPVREVAAAIGISGSAAYRAASGEAPEQWLRAVGLQLGLRGVADRPVVPVREPESRFARG